MLNFELIKKAEINSEFYPFFTVQDAFLNKQDHKKIATDFPKINKGGSFPSDSVSYGQSIQSLLDSLEGDQMRNILENKFQVDLQDKPVVSTFRGYSRMKDGKIHSDSKTKIITVLLYLNKNWDKGSGLLRMLREENRAREMNIFSVPTYIFNKKYLLVGGQESDTFKAYMEKVIEVESKNSKTLNA